MKILEKIFHRNELKRLRSLLTGDLVPLDHFERKMIFDALCAPGYEAKIQAPPRRRFIRQTYQKLKIKIALLIKE